MDLTKLYQGVQNDPAAYAAVDALTTAGGDVHVVGGAVRDLVLGNTPKDIDLMVSGLDQDQIIDALKTRGALAYAGKAFGVFHFTVDGSTVEIAMPRVEYGDTNSDYKVDKDIPVEDDLSRRDFTGNAMAVNLGTGNVLDPYNGQSDLQDGNLRAVSPTAFKDDPTRLLRGAVAKSRFGLEPDEDTKGAMQEHAASLRDQPGERLGMEMQKLLAGRDPESAVRLMHETGMLDEVAPEVSTAVGFNQYNPHHDLDVGNHLFAALKAMQGLSSDPDLRMAALLHDIGKPDSFWRDPDAPEDGGGHFYKQKQDDGSFIGEDHEELGAQQAEELLKRLRYPNDRIQRIVTLIQNHMFPYFNSAGGARKFLASLGGDQKMAFDLLTLREADSMGKSDGTIRPNDRKMVDKDRELLQQVIDQENATTVKDLAINGKDLIQLGYKQGPEIGQVLHQLLDAVIENPNLNTRESLLSMLGVPQAQANQSALEDALVFPNDDHPWKDEWNKYIDKLLSEQRPENGGVEQFLPDYKWSWNGEHLDVWPTKDIMAEDHYERTGPDYEDYAQGRLYKDERGEFEIFVWSNRGTDALQEQAIYKVEDWIQEHYGDVEMVVTFTAEVFGNADQTESS